MEDLTLTSAIWDWRPTSAKLTQPTKYAVSFPTWHQSTSSTESTLKALKSTVWECFCGKSLLDGHPLPAKISTFFVIKSSINNDGNLLYHTPQIGIGNSINGVGIPIPSAALAAIRLMQSSIGTKKSMSRVMIIPHSLSGWPFQ